MCRKSFGIKMVHPKNKLGYFHLKSSSRDRCGHTEAQIYCSGIYLWFGSSLFIDHHLGHTVLVTRYGYIILVYPNGMIIIKLFGSSQFLPHCLNRIFPVDDFSHLSYLNDLPYVCWFLIFPAAIALWRVAPRARLEARFLAGVGLR